jgi:hypothetical protein
MTATNTLVSYTPPTSDFELRTEPNRTLLIYRNNVSLDMLATMQSATEWMRDVLKTNPSWPLAGQSVPSFIGNPHLELSVLPIITYVRTPQGSSAVSIPTIGSPLYESLLLAGFLEQNRFFQRLNAYFSRETGLPNITSITPTDLCYDLNDGAIHLSVLRIGKPFAVQQVLEAHRSCPIDKKRPAKP